MPNLDNPFEIYLKKFRPLAPAPVSLDVPAKPPEKRKHLGITIWSLAVAATAVLGILVVRIPVHRVNRTEENTARLQSVKASQPLTLSLADRALTDSPSIEAALDSLESASARIAVPNRTDSALATLSKEN